MRPHGGLQDGKARYDLGLKEWQLDLGAAASPVVSDRCVALSRRCADLPGRRTSAVLHRRRQRRRYAFGGMARIGYGRGKRMLGGGSGVVTGRRAGGRRRCTSKRCTSWPAASSAVRSGSLVACNRRKRQGERKGGGGAREAGREVVRDSAGEGQVAAGRKIRGIEV